MPAPRDLNALRLAWKRYLAANDAAEEAYWATLAVQSDSPARRSN